MKKITGQHIVSYIIMLIMLYLFICLIVNFYKDGLSLFNIIYILIFGLMGYIVLYILIYPLMKWNKYLNKIHESIFSFPIVLLAWVLKYYMNVAAGILFLMFYIFPTAIVIQFVPNSFEMKMGILYIVNVIAVVIFTYKVQWVMKFIGYTFDKLQPRILNTLAEKVNYRILSYLMMIGIYVLYNFNLFSNNFIQIDTELYMTVVKEVFVTFIAIDSVIQILKNRSDNLKGEKQEKIHFT